MTRWLAVPLESIAEALENASQKFNDFKNVNNMVPTLGPFLSMYSRFLIYAF